MLQDSSTIANRGGRYVKGNYKVPPNLVPLDDDSDPEFNPRYNPPETPVKKRRRGKAVKGKKGNGLRKRVTNEATSSSDDGAKSFKGNIVRPLRKNALLEVFGELGLSVPSEDEDEDEDDSAVEAEDEQEEDERPSSELEEETEAPTILRTFAALEKSRPQMQPASQAGSLQTATPAEDDSETEPESDVPDTTTNRLNITSSASNERKRKSPDATSAMPPTKKLKPDVQDDSVTESETEPETESETEPETEPESEYGSERIKIRPGFARKPEQPLLGPMVLEASTKVQVPGVLNTFLRDYQRDGVQFFWDRYKEGRGGLLGDDMGLGKTIQIIAFLSAIMGKTGTFKDINRRREHVSRLQDGEEWKTSRKLPKANATWPTALIVAPSSVVPNWQRELETWGFFEVGAYSTETGQDRGDVLRDFKLGRLDIMVTSFDLARRDIELLDSLAWSVIIVDEVHRVKNPRSKLTMAFNQFECVVRFGLTGTAIQNDYSELWTILNWTNPGAVGTRKQWESFVTRPLTRGQSKSATQDKRVFALQVAKLLRDKLLPKFFLRRTKALIKDQLPEKIDQVVFCPLTPTQIKVYKRILELEEVQDLIHKDDPCDCGSKSTRKSCCHPYKKGALFRYMSTLIKISNHLALMLPSSDDSPEQLVRNREIAAQVFGPNGAPKFGPAMLQPQYCGKWLCLQTLLTSWKMDPTNKVLVFTKSTKLLEMLEYHLQSQGIGFVKLEGATKQADRMPIIDRFHEDRSIFVFLISTLAGGTGLNLTGANKVVIFDPNWNPAHDLQAMDRAYRFGQTRDVEVFRLLGAGSIEELIYARQVYKQQQMAVGYNASLQTRYFEGVQGDKAKQGELFGIKNIFKLHEDTLATKQTIERANIQDLDWALANLDGKANLGSKQWIYEAEAKGKKENGDLRGLGALMFDDDVTPELGKETEIQKELSDIGVNYLHRNEDLIAENVIEARRLEAIIKKQKTSKKAKAKAAKKQDKSASPEPQWPPKRRHHRPPPGPQEKLASRREAMVELGIISNVDQLPTFAQEFGKKTQEEQIELLAMLDRHARTRKSVK